LPSLQPSIPPTFQPSNFPTPQHAFYNSCALINPDGSYFVYRKIHLFNREKLFFQPGDAPFEVCNAKNGIKIGMMICFDWQFPEATRSLALQGAQIICHPSNLVLPWCQQAMKVRSLENRVFSITANRIGTEVNGDLAETFTGCSQILSIKGDVLASLEIADEGIATVEIDPQHALNKSISERNDAFNDRRPDLYTL
ncbi:MAG: nitrilase-related carbon-nitrogen hydrolase, partial [Candidatus Cloacimonas sp.]|nr:nitrilase-related carbon-nitrogen hydrolase [Candidatus Cloacimonas sp.]